MSSPDRGIGRYYGRVRSALSGRQPQRRRSERLLIVMTALVQPLFQVQLPAYAAAPVVVAAAVATLWR